MKIKINNLMKNLLKQVFLKKIDQVHDENLTSLIKEGYFLEDGCTFLKSLIKYSHSKLINFSDKTGYECFVNKFHLSDFIGKKDLKFSDIIYQGLITSYLIADNLYNLNEINYKVIASIDLEAEDFVLRFHTIRERESYLLDDLEEYEQPIISIEVLRNICHGKSWEEFLEELH